MFPPQSEETKRRRVPLLSNDLSYGANVFCVTVRLALLAPRGAYHLILGKQWVNYLLTTALLGINVRRGEVTLRMYSTRSD